MDQNTEQLIADRTAKLKRIEPFLSLKTVGALAEKLQQEQSKVRGQATLQKQENIQREKPQLLSKSFFELRSLPPKTIRID